MRLALVCCLCGLLLLCLHFLQAHAVPVKASKLYLWNESNQHSRLIFELNQPVVHNIFTLHSPERLVIDLKNTILQTTPPKIAANHSLVRSIRSARRNQNDVRVVLDLKQAVRSKSYALQPAGNYGHRLMVDINTLQNPPPSKTPFSIAASKSSASTTSKSNFASKKVLTTPVRRGEGRDVIIAIDAGHGGIDPGAIGRRYGTKEKTVTLAVAKELARLINQQMGMRAVLTRSGDYYLKLRKRIDIARAHKADLFISIHADAFSDSSANGASVYMLSRRGASSEAAKWLAEKENAADLIGGVTLNDKNDLLASVLLDLSQTGTLEASARVAENLKDALRRVNKMHYSRVQHAAFMVLRAPDIPSVLIETAFLSNLQEEQKLRKSEFRRKIALALRDGIKRYFQRYAPPDSWLARKKTR